MVDAIERATAGAAAWILAGCLLDIPRGSPVECVSDVACEPQAPYCDPASGTCVECLVAADCPADRPTCEAGACRACAAEVDCASGICLVDGTCADEGRVLYAAPAGTGTACTALARCDLPTAVAEATATRDVIELDPGDYTVGVSVSGKRITFAAAGATLHGSGAAAISVTGAGAATIVGGTLVEGDVVVQCDTQSTLWLHRARVASGTVGVSATDCDVTLTRSIVAQHLMTGVAAVRSTVLMTNVVIIGNGNALFGTPGGVYLQEVANARIELTTITGNIGLRGGGVVCDSTGPGALITSSIIYGNMDLDAGALVDAQCLVEHSVVDAYSGPGTANTTGDPLFVAAGDVHLQATSPARGAGDPAVTARVDYDGDVRPQPAASAPDCGADEVP